LLKVAVPTPPSLIVAKGGRIRASVTVKNIGSQANRFTVIGHVYPSIRWWSFWREFRYVSGADGAVQQASRVTPWFDLAPGQQRQVIMQTDPLYQEGSYTSYGIFWQAGAIEILNYNTLSFKDGSTDAAHFDGVITIR